MMRRLSFVTVIARDVKTILSVKESPVIDARCRRLKTFEPKRMRLLFVTSMILLVPGVAVVIGTRDICLMMMSEKKLSSGNEIGRSKKRLKSAGRRGLLRGDDGMMMTLMIFSFVDAVAPFHHQGRQIGMRL
jgi:hypothetical protein